MQPVERARPPGNLSPLCARNTDSAKDCCMYRVIQRVQNNHGTDKLRAKPREQVPLIRPYPAGQTAIRRRSGAHTQSKSRSAKTFSIWPNSADKRHFLGCAISSQNVLHRLQFRRHIWALQTFLRRHTLRQFDFHSNQLLVSNRVFYESSRVIQPHEANIHEHGIFFAIKNK